MTKTQISSLVLFLLAAVSAFATTTEIGSARNLVRLTKCAKTDTVLITRDIDLNGETFSPLCEDGFKGVFDGQGHTISNLTISQNIYFTNNVAFIAKLDGGVLRNLSFDKPNISTYELTDWNIFSASGVSVAVAIGELNGGVVENVHVVDGTVTVNGRKSGDAIDAGGIVGTATSGTISESGGDIDVTNKGKGSVNVGGICGNITGDVTLTGVSYEGNASSLVGAGGNNVTIVSKYGAVTITEKGSTRSAVVDASSQETLEIPENKPSFAAEIHVKENILRLYVPVKNMSLHAGVQKRKQIASASHRKLQIVRGVFIFRQGAEIRHQRAEFCPKFGFDGEIHQIFDNVFLSVAHELSDCAELSQILLRVLFRPVVVGNTQGVFPSAWLSAEFTSEKTLHSVNPRVSAAVDIVGYPEIFKNRVLLAAVELLYNQLQTYFVQFAQLCH